MSLRSIASLCCLAFALCWAGQSSVIADEISEVLEGFPAGIYEDKDEPGRSGTFPSVKLITTSIPARPGISFGYVIALAGGAEGRKFEVIIKQTHPPFTSPDGKVETESVQRLETEVVANKVRLIPNRWDFLDGYEFEFVPGEWKFETIVNGVVVESFVFEVTLEESPGLFPVRVEGKWGLMDRSGTIRVQPTFESIGRPKNGLAEFIEDGQCGFVNTKGEVIVEAKYPPKLFRHFSAGLAHVQIDGKYGYIDTNGAVAISPQFEDAFPFFDGLASVQLGKKWGYIDLKGEMVIPPQFLHASNFFDGLAQITVKGLAGYIDKTGKFVIPAQFEDAGVFGNGLAPVKVEGKWGYIDPLGQMKIAPAFDDARQFSEGLAAVRTSQGWGFVDRGGNWKVEPQYEEASSFSGCRAAVRKNRKWGYIFPDGKLAIPMNLFMADSFVHELAWVAFKPGDFGYINARGGALVWGNLRSPGLQPEISAP